MRAVYAILFNHVVKCLSTGAKVRPKVQMSEKLPSQERPQGFL